MCPPLAAAQAEPGEAGVPAPEEAATPAPEPVTPDPAAVALLDQYRVRSLELRLVAFGYDGFELYRGGALVEEDYDVAFADSPAALEHLDAYYTMTTVGYVMLFAGLGAAIAGVILLAEQEDSGRVNALPAVMLIGGLVLELSGSIVLTLRRLQMNDAVDAYNTDLYHRLRQTRVTDAGAALQLEGSF